MSPPFRMAGSTLHLQPSLSVWALETCLFPTPSPVFSVWHVYPLCCLGFLCWIWTKFSSLLPGVGPLDLYTSVFAMLQSVFSSLTCCIWNSPHYRNPAAFPLSSLGSIYIWWGFFLTRENENHPKTQHRDCRLTSSFQSLSMHICLIFMLLIQCSALFLLMLSWNLLLGHQQNVINKISLSLNFLALLFSQSL